MIGKTLMNCAHAAANRDNGFVPSNRVNMKGGGAEILYLLYRLDPALVRAKNSMGQTPLFYAATMGNLEAVVFLLRVGCRADDRDSNQQTLTRENQQ